MKYGFWRRCGWAVGVCLCSAATALAQADGAASRAGPGGDPDMPVPASVAWMGAVLLGLMWLLIAAIVLGPIVRFFAPKPIPEPKTLPVAH
jgi:hypothetical protein